MPSSLTRGRSSALDYSSYLRVSVSGTVFYSLTLCSISWHLDYVRFTSTFSLICLQLLSECFRHSSTHRCLDRNNRSPAGFHLMRLAIETIEGIGLSTNFPSTTTFVLALGADLPRADCLYPGNLRFSADGDRTRLCVTYACILSSASSSAPRGCAFAGQRNAPLLSTPCGAGPELRYHA